MTRDFEAYLGEGGTLDDLLAMEDVAGIEKIVLMPSPVMHPDNRGVAAAARGNDRIIPCACVSPAASRAWLNSVPISRSVSNSVRIEMP